MILVIFENQRNLIWNGACKASVTWRCEERSKVMDGGKSSDSYHHQVYDGSTWTTFSSSPLLRRLKNFNVWLLCLSNGPRVIAPLFSHNIFDSVLMDHHIEKCSAKLIHRFRAAWEKKPYIFTEKMMFLCHFLQCFVTCVSFRVK